MIGLRLAAALFSLVWGTACCARQRQPLFFKILLFGCASYFLGAVFEGCWFLVYGAAPQGFHVGYLGYMGAWFFLLSAYFGAIDRLADGGEPQLRLYRLGALIAPGAVAVLTIWSLMTWGWISSLLLLLLAIPMGLTGYFALKHLILPDVEMGIIRVMRPCSGCVVLLCLCQALAVAPQVPQGVQQAAGAVFCLLLAGLLPLGEMGVRKWFI